jgi:glycosyltransferase involved in cell wall biosynthesis
MRQDTLMRFAMVTTFYPPYGFGGDATYVRSLSRSLAARGHQVSVIHCADAFRLLNGGDPASPATEDPGVTVHRIETGLGPLSPLITQQTGGPGPKTGRLRAILSEDFDVVHFHNISLVGGLGALGLSRAPCTLYTLHEHWLVCPTHVFWKNRSRPCDKPTCFSCCLRSGTPPQLWRYTGLRDRALQHVDAIISPSRYTAERHRAGGVTQPIEILPLFSALEDATPGPTSRPDLPGAYFLYAGRMTASKGVAVLAAAFAGAPDCHLVLVGDGDLRASLMKQYGNSPNIHFTGALPQSELTSLYAGARALIVPSLAPETFGLTVVEAAAFGVPTLVRKGAGGAEEIVQSANSGYVYSDGADLIAKAREFVAHPGLAREYGERARAAYLRQYTREQHLAGYFQCIDRVLSSKRVNA